MLTCAAGSGVRPVIPFRFLIQPSDYESAVAFYRDTMRLRLVASWSDDGLGTILETPSGAQIELFGTSGTNDPDPGERPHRPPLAEHRLAVGLIWEVADVDDWERDLAGRAVEIVSPSADQPWGFRSLTVRGPDGVLVTLAQPLDGQESARA